MLQPEHLCKYHMLEEKHERTKAACLNAKGGAQNASQQISQSCQ
jgi:hypothetical protein